MLNIHFMQLKVILNIKIQSKSVPNNSFFPDVTSKFKIWHPFLARGVIGGDGQRIKSLPFSLFFSGNQ